MGVVGDHVVIFCNKLRDIPAAVLCVCIFVLQTAVMDYYLIANLSINHVSWLGPDLVNMTLLIVSIVGSYVALNRRSGRKKNYFSLAWISWLLMSIFVSVKTIIAFNTFSVQLREEDPSFFGPNTLKTAIALGSCVFFLLLTTQHDAPIGSERRRYIDELTGTVVFDILDTVDILEILFHSGKVSILWKGMKELILAVATLNLLIPTVPLLTLCKTKFGHEKIEKWLVCLHKLLVVLVVNVPNLFVRLILWHAFSVAITPFTLKNILLICMTIFEFYQHKKEKFEEHEQERFQNEKEAIGNGANSHFRLEIPDKSIKKTGERKSSVISFAIENRIVTDI